MLKNKRPSSINNEKGMAALEMIPILVVIVMFVNFSIGFFGAVHTGILNSIAARNYAFETFRNRSNLIYFRNVNGAEKDLHFSRDRLRVHGTTSEASAQAASNKPEWVATTRLIDFMNFSTRAAETVGSQADHNKTRELPEGRNEAVRVNPIWIKTTYGICLNAECAP